MITVHPEGPTPIGGHDCEPIDTYGFADWFTEQIALPNQAFRDHVRAMRANMGIKDRLVTSSIVADADIDALPARRNLLRDAPQVIVLKLMKRYLNLRYAKRSLKRPISIYLSKIAALTDRQHGPRLDAIVIGGPGWSASHLPVCQQDHR